MAWAQGQNALRTDLQAIEATTAITPMRNTDAAVTTRSAPTFLVGGPPRTGTSWLHEVLQPHAQLPALTKETRFFDLHYARGIDWYVDHFPPANDGRPVGEVAPTYFASREARERIVHDLPGAKMIFIFRHPVQRLVSLYRLKRAYGLVGRDLEAALECDPELMESSRYAAHLAEWQNRFPADQILVNLYEDLKQDPQSFVNRIADFLGMPHFQLTAQSVEGLHPHASARMTQPRWYFATKTATTIADWCKGRNLDNLVLGVRNSRLNRLLLGGGVPFPEIPRATMEKIASLLLPETEKLEALLGRDLSFWKGLPQ